MGAVQLTVDVSFTATSGRLPKGINHPEGGLSAEQVGEELTLFVPLVQPDLCSCCCCGCDLGMIINNRQTR
jgi:hypothetical protein